MAEANTGDRSGEVEIVEVGPRDGLQNLPFRVSPELRIELVAGLAAAGLRRIEIASFVDPRRVPQMADAEEVVRHCAGLPDVSLAGLVLNRRGFDRALATRGLREINFTVAASETFSQRNQDSPIDDNLAAWRDISPSASRAGYLRTVTIATAFGCPYEKEVLATQILKLALRLAESGVDEIALADTIGIATPSEVATRFRLIAAALPGIRLRGHFHNTQGAGYHNALTAVRNGASTVDTSIGGLGGCPFAPSAPGNIETQRMLRELERRGQKMGVSHQRLADIWFSFKEYMPKE